MQSFPNDTLVNEARLAIGICKDRSWRQVPRAERDLAAALDYLYRRVDVEAPFGWRLRRFGGLSRLLAGGD